MSRKLGRMDAEAGLIYDMSERSQEIAASTVVLKNLVAKDDVDEGDVE